MSRLFVWLQHIMPQHLLSRLAGRLAYSRRLRLPLIRAFIRYYKVDLSEAAVQEADGFANFNDFFTRALAPGARPLATAEDAVLCPTDGCISQLGAIDGDLLLQAKGRHFSLAALLGDADEAALYRDGCFATVYLSPRDYHRVHIPLAGRLLQTRYIPGRLFSVNRATAEGVAGLFARNSRLVCEFETGAGPMAMVMVGAMIVADIEPVWGVGWVGPGWLPIGRGQQPPQLDDYRDCRSPVELARGAEMGRFLLGSTVIVLFPPGAVALDPALAAGSPVRMGQALGRLL